jgi:LPXTG-site transpeptidase (sortase) family protein
VTPPPERIAIPGIGVDAPVVALGIDGNNVMEAPKSGEQVGWYDFSAAPGSPGNSVFSGHVDFGHTTAVFWRLKELKAGDRVLVYGPGGTEYRYSVADVASYSTSGPPVEQILSATSYEAITLITCDGTFDQGAHAYDHRLIVRAVRGG